MHFFYGSLAVALVIGGRLLSILTGQADFYWLLPVGVVLLIVSIASLRHDERMSSS